MNRRAYRFAGAVAFVLPIVACATSAAPRPAVDPRYEAVHNALAGAGMAEIGVITRGTLAKGAEARMPIELRPPCTTVVVLGAAGTGDLDATIVDAAGRVIARDATADAEPVVKACVAERGPYTLVLTSNGASGEYLVSEYETDGALAPVEVAKNDGTCAGPFPISDGKLSGSTAHARSQQEGSCGTNTHGREIVYRLELKERRQTIIDVDPKFDAVLYIRKDSCSDEGAEVACNDDAGQEHHSRLEEVLDPGVYYVFVDSYSEGGAYQISVETKAAEPLSMACKHAPELVFGTSVHGNWDSAVDHISGSCTEQRGPDQLYRLTVPGPSASRVRVVEKANDIQPVLHLRTSCDDDATELSCVTAGDGEQATTAAATSTLDPGDYLVVADSVASRVTGDFTLLAERDDEHGEGVVGDTCRGAVPVRASGEIQGDTFHAIDDTSSKCGGKGAPDVVYRIEASHRTRLVASFPHDDARHLLSLSQTCGSAVSDGSDAKRSPRDKRTTCGSTLSAVLTPGSWFLTVDGASVRELGRFALSVELHDARPQEAACRNVRSVRLGETIEGDTRGAVDAFTASCAGSVINVPGVPPAGSGDRVYKFEVRDKSVVRAAVETTGWPAQVAIRRACEDVSTDVEISCGTAGANDPAETETYLEPGTYYVVVDGAGNAGGGSGGGGGKFKLSLTKHESNSSEE